MIADEYVSSREGALKGLPQSRFTTERAREVVSVVPINEAVQAMRDANPRLPDGAAEGIIRGELPRIVALSEVMHGPFYHVPLALLTTTGIIPANFHAVELGPSIFGHWAVAGDEVKPRSVVGVDNQPHIVAAAKVAIEAFKKAGYLPENGYSVMHGDHTTALQGEADVGILSLVSQYEGGEPGTVDWLMKHAGVGVNGDVIHGRSIVTSDDMRKGVLEVRSKRLGEPTGIGWALEGRPQDTPFGAMYDAHLVLRKDVYGKDNRHVAQVPVARGDIRSKVTLVERNGQKLMQPWSYVPGEGTNEEVDEVAAILETLHDVYGGLEIVTQGDRVWDGNAALGVPVYAAHNELYTGAMFTMPEPGKLSSSIVPAILFRHRSEMGLLSQHGMLTQIGEGKKYSSLDAFYEMVRKWMNPASGMDRKLPIVSPLIVTTITSRKPEDLDKLVAATS